MKEFWQKVTSHLAFLPMARALVPLVCGILLAQAVTLPYGMAMMAALAATVAAALLYNHPKGDIFICLMLLVLGFYSAQLNSGKPPYNNSAMTLLEIDDITAQHNNKLYANALLRSYSLGGEEFSSHVKVRVTAPPESGLEVGDMVYALCSLRPYESDTTASRFEKYMLQKGFYASTNLENWQIISATHRTPLRRWANERLARLKLDGTVKPIVDAMTLGERRYLTKEQRQSYTRSGNAHLLAISGMHVGYLFVILNILMAWCACLHRGNIVRCMAVVAGVWYYAAMTGFSPSVMRAATMFSLMQIGLSLPYYTKPQNILATTAFMMLMWDASMLFDAGFLLSVISVAAIVEWTMPIYRTLRSAIPAPSSRLRHISTLHFTQIALRRALGSAVMSAIVGAVATIATAPLVAYMFGTVSFWGVVTGPVMVLLCGVGSAAALLWIILPIGALATPTAWLINGCVTAMNHIADWCAEQGILTFEMHIDLWLCLLCYALMTALTIIKWGTGGKR